MARPVIALLTDFGVRDHYAGVMKGVIVGICPDVTLVDISHDVAPQDVLGGALELAAAYRYFPPGTIFLVVVDPGVGSARRGIAAEAGGYMFVAPDNGVLAPAFDSDPPTQLVELTETRYARPTVSRTFEGRDRFAPAAAWLATGIEVAALGRPAGTWCRIELAKPSIEGTTIRGEVVRVDRFGNLITNIDRRMCETVPGVGLEAQFGDGLVAPVCATYADAAPGHICALFGSTGHLEVAVNGGSAATMLHLSRGAPVHLVRPA